MTDTTKQEIEHLAAANAAATLAQVAAALAHAAATLADAACAADLRVRQGEAEVIEAPTVEPVDSFEARLLNADMNRA